MRPACSRSPEAGGIAEGVDFLARHHTQPHVTQEPDHRQVALQSAAGTPDGRRACTRRTTDNSRLRLAARRVGSRQRRGTQEAAVTKGMSQAMTTALMTAAARRVQPLADRPENAIVHRTSIRAEFRLMADEQMSSGSRSRADGRGSTSANRARPCREPPKRITRRRKNRRARHSGILPSA